MAALGRDTYSVSRRNSPIIRDHNSDLQPLAQDNRRDPERRAFASDMLRH